MTSILIAYHGNCVDGFTSAWVTARALEGEHTKVNIIALHYDEDSEGALLAVINLSNWDRLYIVDYSPSKKFLDNIVAINPILACKTTVIDHHKTTLEEYFPEGIQAPKNLTLNAFYNGVVIIFNINESGASLCWKHFHAGAAPQLVLYSKDYDLWKFEFGDETKWVNKYLRSLPASLETWDMVAKELEDESSIQYVLHKGKELQKEHDDYVYELLNTAKELTLTGMHGLVTECHPKYASDVGNRLAIRSGTFGATHYADHDAGLIRWSLRSVKESGFDVEVIAKAFGGGGHKTAAGFTVPFQDGSYLK